MAADYERDSLQNEDEVVQFISNPVNAYLVAKRFQQERTDFQVLIPNTDFAQDSLSRMESARKLLPTEEDYEGSINALMRLQDTYGLKPAVFAEGIIPQATNASRLSAADCFEIGRVAYNNKDYYHTVMWMKEAYDRLRIEPKSTQGLDKIAILDYLSYAVYMQGNIKHAMDLTNEILQLDPDHERANKNMKYFVYQMEQRETAKPLRGDTGEGFPDEIMKNERNIEDYKRTEEFQTYEALCRDENIIDVKDKHKLYCDYAHNNDPRLLIAPLRREVAHLEPWIMIYYDAIHNDEIQFVKESAFPRLNRATIQNSVTGKLEVANYRITKTAWLNNETDRHYIPRLLNRVSAITQLTLENVEEFQVANYGVGGHYEPHFDFARREEKNAFEKERGNRIATVLFYLTDIPAGGMTVFTQLGVKLKPVKGAAAVWYNLKKNGDGDLTTRHAACPVLVGNKWVMNKWFHERGNELWHPCGLGEEDRFTPYDITEAEPTPQRSRGRHMFVFKD